MKGALRENALPGMVNDPLSRVPKDSSVQSHAHFHVGPAWRGRSGQFKVLRAVASLEVGKGLVVLAAGFGVLFLLHKDTAEMAENLLHLLHISPDHHFAHIFLRWADGLTDRKLWAVSGVAISYSALRFVEAYGLWKARAWAEWIALISGMMYLPIEIRELIRGVSLFHVGLLLVNLGIVFYMMYLRWADRRCQDRRCQEGES
jgi:uncharacterized membrane protein (DUF2068 family)